MDREQGLSLLASRGWLAGTQPEFRNRFLSLARWRAVEPGMTVTLGGEDIDDVVGLAEGSVVLTSVLGEATTPVMHMAHAVFWVGYGPLFLDQPRRVTVEARTSLWVARFPKAKILALLCETPAWWRCLTPLLLEYGDICALIASDLLIRRSDRRLAATILRFAGLRNPGTAPCHPVRLPVTQSELAEASNLSRNVTCVILQEFAAKGWIKVEYRGLVLDDAQGLRRFLAAEPV